MKFTPLKSVHVELGGRLVPFAGWEMPVQYAGISAEHHAVRKSCGVFDISHMGVCYLSGLRIVRLLDGLLTNRVGGLEVCQGQYTFICDANGGVIDDLILYRIAETVFIAVVNASKTEEDIAWLRNHLPSGCVSLEPLPPLPIGLAIQGPRAASILSEVLPTVPQPGRNRVAKFSLVDGEGLIARTGYTGEDGFECFFPQATGERVFRELVRAGVTPCGLGARDSLRLEAGLPLNGNELGPSISPIVAGFKRFVDFGKGEFVGREALLREVEDPSQKIVAFKMAGKSPPPRSGYPVWFMGERAGTVTSGVQSPTLNCGIGFALVSKPIPAVGDTIEVEIRSKAYPAVVCKRPLYRRASK